MKFRQKPSKIFLFASSIFLMLTLASLTVSLPFVYEAKKMIAQDNAAGAIAQQADEEETDNPFADTNEEKASGNSISVTEEYLHEIHSSDQWLAALDNRYLVEHQSIYNAFYGDLISPPPDFS